MHKTLTGTTANGVITYDGSGTNATVESDLTFDGTDGLKLYGDIAFKAGSDTCADNNAVER